jgi:YHS domain-containing protein
MRTKKNFLGRNEGDPITGIIIAAKAAVYKLHFTTCDSCGVAIAPHITKIPFTYSWLKTDDRDFCSEWCQASFKSLRMTAP